MSDENKIESIADRRAQHEAMAQDPDHFSGCPQCPTGKAPDMYLNIHREHWCICETHKTKWSVGSNLFSSWQHETEADWRANEIRLAAYRDVSPPLPDYCHPEFVGALFDGEKVPGFTLEPISKEEALEIVNRMKGGAFDEITWRVQQAISLLFDASMLYEADDADDVAGEVQAMFDRLGVMFLGELPPEHVTDEQRAEAGQGLRRWHRENVEPLTGAPLVGVSRVALARLSVRSRVGRWSPERTQAAFSELIQKATGELCDESDRSAS